MAGPNGPSLSPRATRCCSHAHNLTITDERLSELVTHLSGAPLERSRDGAQRARSPPATMSVRVADSDPARLWCPRTEAQCVNAWAERRLNQSAGRRAPLGTTVLSRPTLRCARSDLATDRGKGRRRPEPDRGRYPGLHLNACDHTTTPQDTHPHHRRSSAISSTSSHLAVSSSSSPDHRPDPGELAGRRARRRLLACPRCRPGRSGTVDETLHHWINDALMSVFFLVAGLEIKRELVAGELRDPKRAALPAVAAIGGMVVPALIYTLINVGGDGANGWGVPLATDIAFAVAVLAIVGKGLPSGLKVFLLSLASPRHRCRGRDRAFTVPRSRSPGSGSPVGSSPW